VFQLSALDAFGLKLAEWCYEANSMESVSSIYVAMDSLETESVIVYCRKTIKESILQSTSTNNNTVAKVTNTGIEFV
jgi:hypothetical protein